MGGVHVITVGVGAYRHHPEWDCADEVEAATGRVARELGHHGARHEDWSHAAADRPGPGGGVIADLQDRLLAPELRGACFLYWTGHGETNGREYWAHLVDSHPEQGHKGLSQGRIADIVAERQNRREDMSDWLVLVLDTCGSCVGAAQVARALGDKGSSPFLPENTAIIATAGDATAIAGVFPDVLEDVFAHVFPTEETISVKEFVRSINDELDRKEPDGPPHAFYRMGETAVLPGRPNPLRDVTAPVDTYEELRRLIDEVPDKAIRDHLFGKAKGTEVTEPAWYFTGRVDERRTLAAWLREPSSGMYVVTGTAGQGKSALLGMLLAASYPAITDALRRIGGVDIPDDLCPPAEVFDAVIHLNQATVDQVIRKLADAVGVEPTADADALERQAEAALRERPRTILLDALDESRDVFSIAVLLRRLARLPGLRMIVGTRQAPDEQPDQPYPGRPDTDPGPIMEWLGATSMPEHVRTLFLEREPDAIRRYVKARLSARLPGVDPERVAAVVRRVAEVEGQPFLFARLAVSELLADPTLFESPSDVDGLLGRGHDGVFGYAVARLKRLDPRIEALLHALAYAKGHGMPIAGRVWEAAAEAVSGLPVTSADAVNTLKAAAPYIMQGSEFDQTVFRLAHRTFVEHYLARDEAEAEDQASR